MRISSSIEDARKRLTPPAPPLGSSAHGVVENVICRWNPYGATAPRTALAAEIEALLEGLPGLDSPMESARLLSRVFMSIYEDESMFGVQHCSEVGLDLFEALTAAGLAEELVG